MCSTATPYGKLIVQKNLKLINGKVVRLACQHPLAIFHYNCNHSANYAQIVREALARYPSTAATPWKIIFYQDGVNPSDGLAKNHSRKASVFYWSFLQFGMRALSHEEVWSTLTLARTTVLNQVEGHVAQITNVALSLFFGSQHDIMRSGVSVHLNGDNGTKLILAEVGVVLADEPARGKDLLPLQECSDA